MRSFREILASLRNYFFNRFVTFFPSQFLRKLYLKNFYGIKISNRVSIWMGLKIFGQNARNISIGNNTMIPSGAMFIVDAPITIGNNVMFGHNVSIMTAFHDCNENMVMKSKEVVIEDDAWIASNAIILHGVKIGKGAIVGAGSVVTKNVPSMEIWAGNPAKKIKERKEIGSYSVYCSTLLV